MMAYVHHGTTINPTASMAHKNAAYSAQLQELVDAFSHDSATTTAIPRLLRETINNVGDAGDFYRRELTQTFLPLLVSSNMTDGMTNRYAIILCSKLIGRSSCDELAAVHGFITYIQRAMESNHVCIARPARDAMMKLVAHAPIPEQMITHADIDPRPLTSVAVECLASAIDANRCLDAIRVLTTLNNAGKLSPDNQLCKHLVETFYETKTPFVSKQTAGLILVVTANDEAVKLAVTRMLVDGATENKPVQAARCWQEVSDVMAFIQ